MEEHEDHLFHPDDYARSLLTDAFIGSSPNETSVATFKFMVVLYVFAGFWSMLAESMLISYIVYFTGKGQTPNSVLAVFVIEAIAVVLLIMLPFGLHKRGLLTTLRTLTGVSMIAIGASIHAIEDKHLATKLFEFVMCVLVSVPFFAITYVGDSYMLEAARMTLLRRKVLAPEVTVFKPLQTIYHRVVGAQGLADLLACLIYALVIPFSWKTRLSMLVVVGAFLWYVSLHVFNDERRIETYLRTNASSPAPRQNFKWGSIIQTWCIPTFFKAWSDLQQPTQGPQYDPVVVLTDNNSDNGSGSEDHKEQMDALTPPSQGNAVPAPTDANEPAAKARMGATVVAIPAESKDRDAGDKVEADLFDTVQLNGVSGGDQTAAAAATAIDNIAISLKTGAEVSASPQASVV